jgi:hypothetical protein
VSSLGVFWRWWTDSWRAPRRARLTYGAMSLAFAGLAVAGAVRGDPVVAAVGGAVAVAVAVLAIVVPRLAHWTKSNAEPR